MISELGQAESGVGEDSPAVVLCLTAVDWVKMNAKIC
jgi:hypothetical protein